MSCDSANIASFSLFINPNVVYVGHVNWSILRGRYLPGVKDLRFRVGQEQFGQYERFPVVGRFRLERLEQVRGAVGRVRRQDGDLPVGDVEERPRGR